MSGHNKWTKIKHGKAITDAQRGRVFSKMSRLLTIMARGGSDSEFNPKLREAIDKAKSVNMPAANIERAIKKGTGELVGEELQEIIFEGYGPGNIALIVEGITDNTNRALSEIKQILHQHQGKLASEGSVRWLFQRKGVIFINQEGIESKEEIELKIIDAGAEDFIWRDQGLEIYTSVNDLEKVKENLKQNSVKINSSTLGWLAKEEIEVSAKDQQAMEKLFEALDENDSVQEVYSNHKD